MPVWVCPGHFWVGPAEWAVVSDYFSHTAEPAGGAGRIQSLRAFRRARVIHAMVRRCNGVTVQWLV